MLDLFIRANTVRTKMNARHLKEAKDAREAATATMFTFKSAKKVVHNYSISASKNLNSRCYDTRTKDNSYRSRVTRTVNGLPRVQPAALLEMN